MKLPLEKEIQADVVKLLETVGAAVYRIGTKRKKGDHQGTMQTPGIPDLIAFVRVPLSSSSSFRMSAWTSLQVSPGRVSCVQLWIEVKRPGGALAGAQLAFRVRALEAGCEHVVGGVDEVLDWLKARGVVK